MLAKLSVSALMFDYVLTGPISGVSAGQYIVGLGWTLQCFRLPPIAADTAARLGRPGARSSSPCLVTLYFFRQNLLGIHESSDKALKIMGVTTVMGVIMHRLVRRHAGRPWRGPRCTCRDAAGIHVRTPDLDPKTDPRPSHRQATIPLGFLDGTTRVGEQLAGPSTPASRTG